VPGSKTGSLKYITTEADKINCQPLFFRIKNTIFVEAEKNIYYETSMTKIIRQRG